MSTELKKVFLCLLRRGLWGDDSIIVKNQLGLEEWSQIFKIAANHTVEGIIFDSFPFLDEDQLPEKPLRIKWAVRVDAIERYNTKMNTVLYAQNKILSNEGLKPILQKGQGVAQYYNNPKRRSSGDIDWYFENEGYKKARLLLKKQKQPFKDSAGFSLNYDWNGVHIEYHKKLFDIQSPFKRKFLKRLLKEYESEFDCLKIDNSSIKILPKELQLLQVNSHILKHLLSFGIGLRQLCDSAILYHRFKNDIDGKKLKFIYKQLGILKWIHHLHAVLVKHIGLPKSSLPFPYPENLDSEWMFNEIWYSGNFGFHDNRYKDGKITAISAQPDGLRRLWLNFKLYFKYAPQEALFYPMIQTFSRFLGKDKD